MELEKILEIGYMLKIIVKQQIQYFIKEFQAERYNIGGHNEKRNIDIVKLILKHLNKPEDLIEYVEDRKGHDYRYAIDPSKINEQLGWKPETKFEDGIIKTIDWYLKNPEWLK